MHLLEHQFFYRCRQFLVDKNETESINRITADFSGLRIAEIGCGPGTNVRMFRNARSYLGLDMNPGYLAKAQELYPQFDFIARDAVTYEPTDQYDVVYIDSLLHHLDDNQVITLLSGITRWLISPESTVIITEPMIAGPDELYHYAFMKIDRGDYFRHFWHWSQLVTAAGLSMNTHFFYELKVCGLNSHHMVIMSASPGEAEFSDES